MKIDLYLTPEPFHHTDLTDKTVIVIDVLRATTTICAALKAGARAVIPASGRGVAGDIHNNIGSVNSVMAGEQKGIKIESFDLGNSPLEFNKDVVGGKFVILCTTNGTPILHHAVKAKKVYCAALVNISRISEVIYKESSHLVIACAGHNGHYSQEDTLCAGKLIDILQAQYNVSAELNDAGSLALLLYKDNCADLPRAVANSEHGCYLSSIGFDSDIAFASQLDYYDIAPTMIDGQLVLENKFE